VHRAPQDGIPGFVTQWAVAVRDDVPLGSGPLRGAVRLQALDIYQFESNHKSIARAPASITALVQDFRSRAQKRLGRAIPSAGTKNFV
jgi:hypothetical protein